MNNILVLAIGSPYEGDNIAWKLVEKIKNSDNLNSRIARLVTLEISDRPGIDLLNSLYSVDHVILIDTVIGATVPAAWYEESAFCYLQKPVSCHEIGLAETLKIGRELGGLPAIELMGLWAKSTTSSTEKAVDMAIKLLLERILQFYRDLKICSAIYRKPIIFS